VSLTFKTSDISFLKQYNTEDINTKFKWDISLDGCVDASKCTYKINSSTIEINLSKHQSTSSVKWTNAIKPCVSMSEKNEIDLNENTPTNNMPQVSNSGNAKKTTKTTNAARSRSASSSVSPSPPQTYNRKPVTPPNPNATNTYYGFVGLANLGNTCYMNAALQCLLNTTDLRDYFIDTPHLFQKEINTNNSLGLNGRLAVGFGMLMRQIWKGSTTYIAPNQLRDLICSKYAHFRGYEQQDTHEFLCSLLSILHEDLNRVLKKPFYESGLECEDESFGQEFKIANESWQRFLSRENSIIVDNFYGQFKSKLICPECNKVSITFEPFNSLLVPIPSPKINVDFVLMFNALIRQRQTIKV
jgi:ubiquitin carboxyl-terminal hydrolase 19